MENSGFSAQKSLNVFIIQLDPYNHNFIKLYIEGSSDVHYIYESELFPLFKEYGIEIRKKYEFLKELNSFSIIKLQENGEWTILKKEIEKMDIFDYFNESLKNLHKKKGFPQIKNTESIFKKDQNSVPQINDLMSNSNNALQKIFSYFKNKKNL